MTPKDKPQNHCDGWQLSSHYHPKEGVKTIGALQLCPDCLDRYQETVRSYADDKFPGGARRFTVVGPS